MSITIEPTLSNRSTCKECKNKIDIGTKRLVKTGVAFGHPTKSLYCNECGIKILKDLLKELEA